VKQCIPSVFLLATGQSDSQLVPDRGLSPWEAMVGAARAPVWVSPHLVVPASLGQKSQSARAHGAPTEQS
jgi:hypothetical protein